MINALTDVPGIRVGHAERVGDGWLTGTTVVLGPDSGMAAAVDVRGGGPATRETDALAPGTLVPRIDAVVLTGGSAYGLAAADGVMLGLEEAGRGFPVGSRAAEIVPVVPAAALFDLGRGGDFRARPDADLGRAALDAATDGDIRQGGAGAGTGALAGGIRAGVGTASVRLDDCVVAALVVVNAAGSLVDPATGLPYALHLGLDGEFPLTVPPAAERVAAQRKLAGGSVPPRNTVIGVIATDAALERGLLGRLATTGHDGLARAIRPAHTLFDGDTLFALSTAAAPERLDPVTATAIHAAGADAVARAVVHALLAAEPATTDVAHYPSYRELYPSATLDRQ